jgi:hypothetical protein
VAQQVNKSAYVNRRRAGRASRGLSKFPWFKALNISIGTGASTAVNQKVLINRNQDSGTMER